MKSLTPYQQAILAELGIVQYRLRQPLANDAVEPVPTEEQSQPQEATPKAAPVKVVEPITGHSMLLDIQQALVLTGVQSEITWYPDEDISFDGEVLKSPPPSTLETQPGLKRILWQVLQQT